MLALLACSFVVAHSSPHKASPLPVDVEDAPLLRSGTAFFVSPDGLMLTSAHNVKGCRHINIWRANGPPLTALIRALERHLDLALLTTPAVMDVAALAPWGSGEPPQTALYTIGFGLTPSTPRVPVLTQGSIDRVVSAAGHPVLVVRARLHEGNSGGPVVDRNGVLRGIIVGRYSARPELGVAVRTEEIAPFLKLNGVDLRWSKPGVWPDGGALQQLRRIAALVQCSDAIEGANGTRGHIR